MITLGTESRVIVPYQDKDGNAVDVNEYEFLAVELAGGATSHDAAGSWIDDSGELIREPVRVIDCACGDDATDNSLFDLAAQIAVELNQDCVYFRDRHGTVHLVEQGDYK